jgi:phospholipase/carboxylesterase
VALVLVHGRHQDAAFMLEVAERVALPQAALLAPEPDDGVWYPGRFFDPPEVNEPHVTRAVGAIEEALARTSAAGVPTVLVGFSQGACMVAEALRRAPREVVAAAVLTGALMGDAPAPTPHHVAGLPMLFSASRHDDWIPLQHTQAVAASFALAGADVTSHVSGEREHHVSDAEATAVRELVERALG